MAVPPGTETTYTGSAPKPPDVKTPKPDKPVKVRSINTVLAHISDTGAHGSIGRVRAKAIRAALDAAGFEIVAKPVVKPVEVKRADPAKPVTPTPASGGMYVPPVMRGAPTTNAIHEGDDVRLSRVDPDAPR